MGIGNSFYFPGSTDQVNRMLAPDINMKLAIPRA